MRNLAAAIRVHQIELEASDDPCLADGGRVQAFCLGAGDGRIYCATDAAATTVRAYLETGGVGRAVVQRARKQVRRHRRPVARVRRQRT